MPRELSLIDQAAGILARNKQPYDLFDLFDEIAAKEGITDDEKATLIGKFYTDLTTSAKFVYVGDNKWALKQNEKVELWEKDGSFYKEYTVIDLPEEYKVDPYAPVRKPKPAVVHKVEVEVVKEEELVVEPEQKVVPVVEPVIEPVAQVANPAELEETEEDFDEEVFDEYDDFDEDKYNEYMDTYEDQYED